MPLPDVPINREPNRRWINRHLNVQQDLDELITVWKPATGSVVEKYKAVAKALEGLIAEAIADQVRIRGLGSSWSISRVAAVNGRLVDTKPLNDIIYLRADQLDPGYAGSAEGLILAQCGTGIMELHNYLNPRGRSIRTCGASNGQTIAGAIATGTHGSAIGVGSLQDSVVGLHLVLNQRQVWLERASYPVMTEETAKKLGADLKQDDALFNAALVSFGAFGFVHGVLLETDPLFVLEAWRRKVPRDASLENALTTLDFDGYALPGPAGSTDYPFHVDTLINPFKTQEYLFLRAMYRRPGDTPHPPVVREDGIGPGDDAAAFLGALTDVLPDVTPLIVKAATDMAGKDLSDVKGSLAEMFSHTDPRGKVLGTGIGCDKKDCFRVLDVIAGELAGGEPVPALSAFRYVKGSGATLAFTRFPTSCIVDIDLVNSSRGRDFLRRCWKALSQSGIEHTLHWGKANNLTATKIRKMYGDAAVGSWIQSREDLLDAPTRAVFTNAFLESVGLTS